jgi:hypothetical protein
MEYTAFFYEVDGQVCRKYLDIKTPGLPNTHRPDIVFICLNPGSCEAKDYGKPVRVNADPTILQLSNLIGFHDIKYIRLLNLSDYREQKSKDFFQRIKNGDFEKYSLFSSSRQQELNHLFPLNSKVIAAWGVNPENRNLTKMAMAYLEKRQIVLLNHDSRPYHPLPRGTKRKQWIIETKNLLSRHYS